MKKKLLSPNQLNELNAAKSQQTNPSVNKLEESKTKRLKSPKNILDYEPENSFEEFVVEDNQEIDIEVQKDPIELLHERLDEIQKLIQKPINYDSQIEYLENLIYEKYVYNENFDLTSVHKKIEDVRNSIPKIPEQKTYDDEIKTIRELINNIKIPEVPEVRYYDDQIQEIYSRINSIVIPEVKYYDQQLEELVNLVNSIVIPEVKYYDDAIEILDKKIDSIIIPEEFDSSEILNQISDLKLKIEDLKKIPEPKFYDDNIDNLISMIEDVRKMIPDIPEIKYYDNDILELKQNFDIIISEIKNQIPEVPEIPEVRYYEDDLKDLSEEIKSIEDIILDLPQVKYYDEDVKLLNLRVDKLSEKINEIKIPEQVDWSGDIQKLYERITELSSKEIVEQKDPLVPLDQNFVTFDELREHYRLFINRIQQQLSSLGGGGETRLEFLDDVDRNSVKQNGHVLQWNSSVGKFIGTTYVSGSGASDSHWVVDSVGINTYKNVGIGTTAKPGYQLYVQDKAKVVDTLEVSGLTITNNTIDVGINSLTINSGYISVASSIIPAEDGVYDLGSADKQWKAIHVFGSTIFLDGVPLELSDNTVSIGGTNLALKPELDDLSTEVNFLSTGIQLVGYFDASVGVVTHLTSYGESQGIYVEGHSLPASGISTGNYFIVSKSGNNIGIATFVNSGITTAYVGDWIGATSSNTWAVLSYSDSQIVPISNDSLNLDNKPASYYLNYNNLSNTPTNLSQFNNNVGFITSGGTLNTTGIVTATRFFGDGSGLTNIVATGSGIEVRNEDTMVGMAITVNFSNKFTTTLHSAGVIGIGLTVGLDDLNDVDTTGLQDGYLMVYNAATGKFRFVDPKTIGINNDFNPDPDIDDYGTY